MFAFVGLNFSFDQVFMFIPLNSKQTTRLRFYIHLYTSIPYIYIYIRTFIHISNLFIFIYMVRVQCTINPHLLLQQLKGINQRTDVVRPWPCDVQPWCQQGNKRGPRIE